MARRADRRSAFSKRGRVLGRGLVLAGGTAAVAAAALGAFLWDRTGCPPTPTPPVP